MNLKEIKQNLRKLGLESEYGYRPEIKLIPDSLDAGESLLAISSGIRKGRRWYIVLTEKRLLMLTKPTMGSPSLIALDRAVIQQIEKKKGLLFASITVKTEEGKYRFSNVLKKSVAPFLAAFHSDSI